MNPQESIIRTILRNEITWTIAIILGIWGFVQTVILPLNELQLGVASINEKLVQSQLNTDILSRQIEQNTQDIIRHEGRINALERK